MNIKTLPPGFRPHADGGPGARFGRDPVTGRAYTADGTVRAARQTKTPAERVAQKTQEWARTLATAGRAAIGTVPALAQFTANIARFRRYVRECRAYGTPEAVAARAAYFRRMAEACEAKGEAAQQFLADTADAVTALDTLGAKVGKAAVEAAGLPEAEREAAIVGAIDPALRAVVESAADPEADPLREFRRDAPEADGADDADDADDAGL